jgi:phosphatidate cytidylyltransferase
MAETDSRVEKASEGWPRGATAFERRYGNATTRVVVGVIAIPIIIGAVLLGGWLFFLFVAAISTGALLEFYWLLEKRGALPNKALGVVAGLLLAFVFMHGVSDRLLLGIFNVAVTDLSLLLARFAFTIGTLVLFAVAVMIDEMWRKEGRPVVNNVATFAGVTYISLFLATLVGIRQLFSGDITMVRYLERMSFNGADSFGAYTVIAILVSIWICDSAAYYAGRAFGRHKLFERVSPKKTWEGAIAGALAAVGAMIGMKYWFLGYLTLPDAIVIGAIAGVFGQIGDLAESHLKRDAGIKDSSQIIPGHGGLFDRFDSLLFVAPLVYLYLNFIILTR